MLKTPLFDEHLRLQARMTEFAGWSMPVWYEGIRKEHVAVRERAGLFDVSHMGRLVVSGPDRERFVDRLSTNRITGLAPGVARYTLFCDETGGVIDDLLVMAEEDRLLVVCNASNRDRVVCWMTEQKGSDDAELEDRTLEQGMIAVQGPAGLDVLARAGLDCAGDLRYFRHRRDRFLGLLVSLSRTGYTGEDGFELVAPAAEMGKLWKGLLAAGAPVGLVPVGLGARDTLRIEAALPLYGHEISERFNPIHAGLRKFVRFRDRAFIGRDALWKSYRNAGEDAPHLAGLELAGRRIARTDQEILHDGKPAGHVTSGTWSPTFEKSIAIGYVPGRLTKAGTSVSVRVSDRKVNATLVELPFYARRKKTHVP